MRFLFFLLFATCFLGAQQSDGATIGKSWDGYRNFAILANKAVGEKNLEAGSSLETIENFLISSDPDAYLKYCILAVDGPKVFSVQKIEQNGTSIIGFTEEVPLIPKANDQDRHPGTGRIIFLWDNDILRANLYKEDQFQDYVKFNYVNLESSNDFSFTGLAKLSALESRNVTNKSFRRESKDGSSIKLNSPTIRELPNPSRPKNENSGSFYQALLVLSVAFSIVAFMFYQKNKKRNPKRE